MDDAIHETLALGLTQYESSVKRAKNTARNKQFEAIYDTELANIAKARTYINDQKAAHSKPQK